jgi:hypothetical protein
MRARQATVRDSLRGPEPPRAVRDALRRRREIASGLTHSFASHARDALLPAPRATPARQMMREGGADPRAGFESHGALTDRGRKTGGGPARDRAWALSGAGRRSSWVADCRASTSAYRAPQLPTQSRLGRSGAEVSTAWLVTSSTAIGTSPRQRGRRAARTTRQSRDRRRGRQLGSCGGLSPEGEVCRCDIPRPRLVRAMRGVRRTTDLDDWGFSARLRRSMTVLRGVGRDRWFSPCAISRRPKPRPC